MPRYQSVRRHAGCDRIDPPVEFSPSHGAAHQSWLNKRDAIGLRLSLTGNKISKVGIDGPRVDQPGCRVQVVHPSESGTRNSGLDIMVMT